MQFNKVIIWGHKNTGHTQQHIHRGWYRGFQSLGYDIYWFDNSTDVSGMDFNNCLFFTEGQVEGKVPIIPSATYLLHHCNIQRYLEAGCNILNVCNYVRYCQDGISFNYKDQGNTVEKLGDLFFYDAKAKAVYQPWATDQTPDEIDENFYCPYDETKQDINFVGLIWDENIENVKHFKNACIDRGKKFINYMGITDPLENKRLTLESYVVPDFRGEWHKECGYIPCRLFKTMSYGHLVGTNGKHLKELFGDRIAYDDFCYTLFDTMVEKHKSMTAEQLRDNIMFIKQNHTYVNRIKNNLYLLEQLYG